ncbi:hypothetical protein GQX73_g10594 [Xylaria multiplex]|uniref:DUF676 domain-containing protein n=1 Tax=Xylaria multiplex TaxID=323545 RepID=A0A7C8IGN7_9PEZI|nr:hypothetical protein GQX73_g10594 [Xylaria multiplex]
MSSAASDFKGLTGPQSSVYPSPAATKSPFGGLYDDPRTSSTQSLAPSLPPYEEIERRKLLIIYIHGFMGNDTSFQSFPAHVHKYLKLALFDSHVVHSKIYPRYKTYKSIEIARDNFSTWLEHLESPKTDIILVGHSMGGLLAADIVLKPPTQQQHHQHTYFKHRILGVVNLDAPLLGMHPGIIVSGISSLFRKTEPPKLPGEQSTLSALSPGTAGLPSPNLSMYSVPSTITDSQPSPPPPPAPFTRPALTNDSNFNTNYPNDVRMEERTWWKNVVHFVKKHNSEGLIDAAANHVMSHLEFGGTMFEINNLKTRYDNIRRLEDVDDLKQAGFSPPQVRFIQYYTICNGFPKKPKEAVSEQEDTRSPSIHGDSEKVLSSPNTSVDGPSPESQNEIFKQDITPLSLPNSERSSLELLSPEPILDEPPPIARNDSLDTKKIIDAQPNDHQPDTAPLGGHGGASSPPEIYPIEDKVLTAEVIPAVAALDLDLPSVPELPPKPDAPDLDTYTDKDARKLAEKEAKRAQKTYEKAVKDREKAIKDREKIIEKRRKKLAQEAEKQAKEDKKRRKKEEAATAAATKTSPPAPAESGVSPSTPNQEASEKPNDQKSQPLSEEWTPVSPDRKAEEAAAKKKEKEKAKEKKDREKEKERAEKRHKFCNVPKSNGRVDPKWISVFMKDMDQVAAHTSLFFAGEHYDGLVGDVGNTIVEWVHADMSKRMILGLP